MPKRKSSDQDHRDLRSERRKNAKGAHAIGQCLPASNRASTEDLEEEDAPSSTIKQDETIPNMQHKVDNISSQVKSVVGCADSIPGGHLGGGCPKSLSIQLDSGRPVNSPALDDESEEIYFADDGRKYHRNDNSKKTSISEGRPLQIVFISDRQTPASIAIHEENLAELETNLAGLDQVAIIAVMGAFRSGKSFLLDLFLRYLSALEAKSAKGPSAIHAGHDAWRRGGEPVSGFPWRGGMDACTEGIWVWSRPFVRKDGVGILLMDTQGAWDSGTSKAHSATIFGLTALMSSLLIYNVTGQIQEDKVENLHYFVECAMAALRAVEPPPPNQLGATSPSPQAPHVLRHYARSGAAVVNTRRGSSHFDGATSSCGSGPTSASDTRCNVTAGGGNPAHGSGSHGCHSTAGGSTGDGDGDSGSDSEEAAFDALEFMVRDWPHGDPAWPAGRREAQMTEHLRRHLHLPAALAAAAAAADADLSAAGRSDGSVRGGRRGGSWTGSAAVAGGRGGRGGGASKAMGAGGGGGHGIGHSGRRCEEEEEEGIGGRAAAEAVRRAFRRVSCWCLPHPGLVVHSAGWAGDLSQVSPHFLDGLGDYMRRVFSDGDNSDPGPARRRPASGESGGDGDGDGGAAGQGRRVRAKRILGRAVSGRMFGKVLRAYAKAFEGGAVPSPACLAVAVARANNLVSKEAAAREFRRRAEEAMEAAWPSLSNEELADVCAAAWDRALQIYDSTTHFGPEHEARRARHALIADLESAAAALRREAARRRECALAGLAGLAVAAAACVACDTATDYVCDWWFDPCVGLSRVLAAAARGASLLIAVHAAALWAVGGWPAAATAVGDFAVRAARLAAEIAWAARGDPAAAVRRLGDECRAAIPPTRALAGRLLTHLTRRPGGGNSH